MTTIAIAVPAERPARWHAHLRDRLARRWPDACVTLTPACGGADGWSTSVEQLLALERIILKRGRPSLCDRLEIEPGPRGNPDIVIDLTGARARQGREQLLRPLYDGRPSEAAAVAALLSRQAPELSILDVGANRRLARGTPSLEAMDGLTGGLDAVYSRLIVLLVKAIAAPTDDDANEPKPFNRSPPAPLSFLLSTIAFQSARAIYRLCCHAPHWRVGWRFTHGPGVLETGRLADAPWRVMRDPELSFAADPLPIDWEGRRGVFYERINYRSNRGEIYFQRFGDDGPSGEPALALSEPWHLSYPFLLVRDGSLYMLPEASLSGKATLYRCVAFPDRWEPVATLLDNIEAADATIFRHGGLYWMTSVVRDGYGGYSDTLALHHAESLFGPWAPHRRSPLLVDPRSSRPAGAVIQTAQGLLRPVQDCSAGYGRALTIMRIERLDRDAFEQSPLAHIPPGVGWPGSRLHTINRWGSIECIDGVTIAPKPRLLRRLANAYLDTCL